MSYCKKEDGSATVTWQWNNDSPKKLTLSIVPIDVIVSPQSAEDIGTWTMITYDAVTASAPFAYTGTYAESPIASGRELRTASTNRLLYSDGSVTAGAIRLRDVLFTPNNPSGYKIKIFDITGKLLFEDFKATNNPPKYEIVCGNRCPEGYIKCACDAYPGYCCIPCSEIRGGIASATSALRSINNG
ncbi:MAG: hypothetical protein KME31_27360 [Tolypothrix carrinoi HA7290-LM1]|jgi:hypothetical protein|nr:hypothetical protein [Tolypothrix carrinoi HA7290-LM1]